MCTKSVKCKDIKQEGLGLLYKDKEPANVFQHEAEAKGKGYVVMRAESKLERMVRPGQSGDFCFLCCRWHGHIWTCRWHGRIEGKGDLQI